MNSQVLSSQISAAGAFAALLRAHAALRRRLSAELVAGHGLTINAYEVLLRLSGAPERRMRGVDLAQQVLLSASGITRLLDGLEKEKLIERIACPDDRRAVHAVLTNAGERRFQAAAKSHIAQIDTAFAERLSEDEIAAVAELLERLASATDAPNRAGT